MNTGSIGVSADPQTDSQSLPPIQVGQGQHVLALGAEDDLGVLGHVAGGAVDGADHVLRHRRPRPEELAGGAVDRVDDAGLAGNAGQDPPCLAGREPGVDPAHGRPIGRHRRVDGDALEGWSRSQWSFRCC